MAAPNKVILSRPSRGRPAVVRLRVSRRRDWVRLASVSEYNSRVLAVRYGVTLRQLERYFLEDFGRPPQDWLNEQRLIAARRLLRQGWPVKAVAYELGYKQESHFCRQFKRCYGVTPSTFPG